MIGSLYSGTAVFKQLMSRMYEGSTEISGEICSR